jgi:hypothetical protein
MFYRSIGARVSFLDDRRTDTFLARAKDKGARRKPYQIVNTALLTNETIPLQPPAVRAEAVGQQPSRRPKLP